MNLPKLGMSLLLISTLAGCQLLPNTAEPDATEATTQPTQQADTNATAEIFSGSYFDLLGRGDSQQCTWTETSETGETHSGVVYIDGQTSRMRSETTIQIPDTDETTQVYGLVDEEFIYTWSSDDEYAFKMALEDVTNQVASSESDELPSWQSQLDENSTYIDLEAEVDFKCQPWRVDETLLTRPSDIAFKDMTEFMNLQMESMGLPEDIDVCSYCDQLPAGEARDACLAGC